MGTQYRHLEVSSPLPCVALLPPTDLRYEIKVDLLCLRSAEFFAREILSHTNIKLLYESTNHEI